MYGPAVPTVSGAPVVLAATGAVSPTFVVALCCVGIGASLIWLATRRGPMDLVHPVIDGRVR